MKAQLDKVIKLLNPDLNAEITINNKRCNLPTAYAYPNLNKIVVVANKPALIRYALSDLIGHELAELEFDKALAEQDLAVMDTHEVEAFQDIEMKYKSRILTLMNDEHE